MPNSSNELGNKSRKEKSLKKQKWEGWVEGVQICSCNIYMLKLEKNHMLSTNKNLEGERKEGKKYKNHKN